MVDAVRPFDSASQTWEEYCDVLDHFFVANDIQAAERKQAVLLSSVGAQTYALMRTLLSPVKPGDRFYEDLVKLLKDHYHPKPSEIMQRWKFNTRNRLPDESVRDYVAELRKLAHNCNFGDTLTMVLRDRLVCGINDDNVQRRLLLEDGLTFDKALKKAQAMEAANRDIVDLQGAKDYKVHKVSDVRAKTQQDVRSCYRCKGTNHVAMDCRFAKERCHNSGKVGHIKRACKMRDMGGQKTTHVRGESGKFNKRANFMQEEGEDSDTEEVFTIYHVKDNESGIYNMQERNSHFQRGTSKTSVKSKWKGCKL